MRLNEKNKKILNKVAKDINFCDIIIMRLFKRYTCKVYRIGFNDAFNWENQKYGKNLKSKNQ